MQRDRTGRRHPVLELCIEQGSLLTRGEDVLQPPPTDFASPHDSDGTEEAEEEDKGANGSTDRDVTSHVGGGVMSGVGGEIGWDGTGYSCDMT
jgi:hypothetical protein